MVDIHFKYLTSTNRFYVSYTGGMGQPKFVSLPLEISILIKLDFTTQSFGFDIYDVNGVRIMHVLDMGFGTYSPTGKINFTFPHFNVQKNMELNNLLIE